MWIELISDLYPEVQFAPPATSGLVDSVEDRLGVAIASDLRQLLMESDGVLDEYSVDVVWPADRIANDNLEFRIREDFARLYAPFDSLVFFGDNGGGDQFAFPKNTTESGVFVWEHETDTRRKVADGLSDYLVRRLTADGDEWYLEYED